jgi:serine/threonine protein kinase
MVTLCWVQQVAAIFKIGNSKDIPQIPESLSNDAKSFIKLCLQRDPPARPKASELLNHPFIRDQATTFYLILKVNCIFISHWILS